MFVGRPGPGLACLPVFERDRHHFVGKVTARPGLSGARLAQRRETVYRLPADAVLLAQVLRRFGHGESALRVAQRLPETVLQGRRRTEAEPPARAPHHVRGLAHTLGPPGQHHFRLAQEDLLRPLSHGFEA